jgi:hypothetical protein
MAPVSSVTRIRQPASMVRPAPDAAPQGADLASQFRLVPGSRGAAGNRCDKGPPPARAQRQQRHGRLRRTLAHRPMPK